MKYVFLLSSFLLTSCNPTDLPGNNLITYKCANDIGLKVEYQNATDQPKAKMRFQNQDIPMHLVPSGSGARYASDDMMANYIWHTKGDAGILTRQQENQQEETLARDCFGAP